MPSVPAPTQPISGNGNRADPVWYRWWKAVSDLLDTTVGGTSAFMTKAANLSDVTTPATAFANIKQAATDTATGAIELAIQSEMETATDVVRAVVPGRQQFHPSAAKFWAFITWSGATPSLITSYNMTSITDTALGRVTLTIATDFSSGSWAPMATPETAGTGDGNGRWCCYGTPAAGSVEIQIRHTAASGGTTDLVDPASVSAMGFGDQ